MYLHMLYVKSRIISLNAGHIGSYYGVTVQATVTDRCACCAGFNGFGTTNRSMPPLLDASLASAGCFFKRRVIYSTLRSARIIYVLFNHGCGVRSI